MCSSSSAQILFWFKIYFTLDMIICHSKHSAIFLGSGFKHLICFTSFPDWKADWIYFSVKQWWLCKSRDGNVPHSRTGKITLSQGQRHNSHQIIVPHFNTRECRRTALDLMHTQIQTLREGELANTEEVKRGHSSNRPSRILSKEKGTNLKPWPE